MDYHEEILARYSTPGLKRHELTRAEKKFQLDGLKITGARAKEILDALYGPEVDTLCPTV
jgi:hypothetical protein